MIIVDNVILSDDVADSYFACDLSLCKGACCIEGDSGAPVSIDELPVLESIYETVKEYLPEKNRDAIAAKGLFEVDNEGEFCTTTIGNNNECVFAIKENNIWTCGIEKAYNQGKIDFQKPISCHLYPIRVTHAAETDLLNYHRWDICSAATVCGKNNQIPLYKFLKSPLVRQYGEEWYQKLEETIEKR